MAYRWRIVDGLHWEYDIKKNLKVGNKTGPGGEGLEFQLFKSMRQEGSKFKSSQDNLVRPSLLRNLKSYYKTKEKRKPGI